MDDETVKRAFAIVGRYQAQSEMAPHYWIVGRGPYALLAVFDDGSKQVKAQGLDSVSDAEVYAAYAEAAAPGALRAVRQQIAEAFGEAPEPRRKFVRFEIVSFAPVVTTSDLAKLPRIE